MADIKKVCPNCKAEHENTAKFCRHCGATLKVVKTEPAIPAKPVENICPKCNAVQEKNAKFCRNCGAALSGPAIAVRNKGRLLKTLAITAVAILAGRFIGGAIGEVLGAELSEKKENRSMITATSTPIPTLDNTISNLYGEWYPEPVYIRGGGESSSAFGLYEPVFNCTELTLNIAINDYTGYPFDEWYLYIHDLEGNWRPTAMFTLADDMILDKYYEFPLKFDDPESFDALAICHVYDGYEFSIDYSIYYSDAKLASKSGMYEQADGTISQRSGEWTHEGGIPEYVFDERVNNCTELTMNLTILDNPNMKNCEWYLIAADVSGNSETIGRFVVNDSLEPNMTCSYTFCLHNPVSFDKLWIFRSSGGTSYWLYEGVSFTNVKTQ